MLSYVPRVQMEAAEIKELRMRLGWVQLKMATELGVQVLTVRRWEKGYFKPSPLALNRLHQLRDSLLEKVT